MSSQSMTTNTNSGRDDKPHPPEDNDDLATDHCPQCGTHVDVGDRYCRTCGAELEGEP